MPDSARAAEPRRLAVLIEQHLDFAMKTSDWSDVSTTLRDNIVGARCARNTDLPVCGNGVVEVGEACDDGNGVSGAGCSANCAAEAN